MNNHNPNQAHILGVRDAAFAAIDVFTKAKGLDEVNALDAVIGLTLAVATIIKDAPDSETKARLQYAVMQAVSGSQVNGRTKPGLVLAS